MDPTGVFLSYYSLGSYSFATLRPTTPQERLVPGWFDTLKLRSFMTVGKDACVALAEVWKFSVCRGREFLPLSFCV